jgi:D-alanyl-D-alanine dipeptidase
LQSELYDVAIADPTISPDLFAVPSTDPQQPSPHETGGAVDLTLTVGGIIIAAGTDFDDPTPRAAAAALEDTPGPDREARRLLYWSMWSAGFVVFKDEWWHFELGTRRWASIGGQTPLYGPALPPS